MVPGNHLIEAAESIRNFKKIYRVEKRRFGVTDEFIARILGCSRANISSKFRAKSNCFGGITLIEFIVICRVIKLPAEVIGMIVLNQLPKDIWRITDDRS